jgi:hypothetical protein
MANEIRTTIDLRAKKDSLSLSKRIPLVIDMAGDSYSAFVQAIGAATPEVLAIGSDVTTAGVAVFHNHSATATITLYTFDGSVDFHDFATIPPGEAAFLRLSTKDIYAMSDSVTANLEHIVLEE